MRREFFLSSVTTGIVVGGLMLSFSNPKSTANVNYKTASIIPTAVIVNSDEDDNIKHTIHTDLTFASAQSVEAVAHITTEFTKEQITYDPFLRLFYGEDAYRKRELHGASSGSGVVISDNGYLVTNNHVVQDAHTIYVNLGNEKYKAQLVGTDPSTDLAIIKIEEKNLPHLEFSNSDALKLGEWVIAVGNPLKLQTTVTAGIVSAKNRNIDLLTKNLNPDQNVFPVESFIQTDAAVNSGNSGGALVDSQGKLVGINTAIASGNGFYTGYSFAIPSNIVKKVAWDIVRYGKVNRVFMGVSVLNNNSEIAKKKTFSTQNGVIIAGIQENGAADKARLKVNDIIVGMEDNSINTTAEFQSKLLLYNPGEKVNLTIVRGQEKKKVSVEL